jgi:hypothetical protein
MSPAISESRPLAILRDPVPAGLAKLLSGRGRVTDNEKVAEMTINL